MPELVRGKWMGKLRMIGSSHIAGPELGLWPGPRTRIGKKATTRTQRAHFAGNQPTEPKLCGQYCSSVVVVVVVV